MRYIVTLALSLAAIVTAAPKAPSTGALVARQQCTVDCTCLAEDRTRSWDDTQRCCSPNGGTLDNPVCTLRSIWPPSMIPAIVSLRLSCD
jgi:hypothetical protein